MGSRGISRDEASGDGAIFWNAFDWTALLQQVCRSARWMHFQSDPVKLRVAVSSPPELWSNVHDYMLILSEAPSSHERCTCCSKVMISQVSIPLNNLPLRTHFYQLIAKAPVECICGCFLFYKQFSRCSGSQGMLRTPRSAKKHSLCTNWV